MKFRPGSSFGKPLSPLFRPNSLICRIAILSCSESQFSQFVSCTLGSADSSPKESTAPSERVEISDLVISVEGSKFSATIEGFALSTWSISNLSSCRKPCRTLAIGSGLGMGYSSSTTPSAL